MTQFNTPGVSNYNGMVASFLHRFSRWSQGLFQANYTYGHAPVSYTHLTFNINNINKRLDNLLAWLAKAEPDVVSLQELKAEQGAFPANALRKLGYEAVWQGERSWNGVAILARNHVPVLLSLIHI